MKGYRVDIEKAPVYGLHTALPALHNTEFIHLRGVLPIVLAEVDTIHQLEATASLRIDLPSFIFMSPIVTLRPIIPYNALIIHALLLLH